MNDTFGLYLILTDPLAGYEKVTEAAVKEEVRYLQLRMKHADHASYLSTAKALRRLTVGSNTRLIINDNLQIAIEADADGIHLGQKDQNITEARETWNNDGKVFGLSTHSMEQALQTLKLKPDYIGIGPVFPTPTKPDTAPALGIDEAGRIAAETPVTSVAIGGINEQNLPDLLKAGARNYCVVRAVNSSPNPAGAIRRLQAIWKNHVI